jgi:hypothetical protein
VTVALGFLPKPLSVLMDNILPSRKIALNLATSPKFKQIVASIREIDLIEPLAVGAVDRRTGQHLLLDGHLRLAALQELGYAEAPCLVATDDEAYTYNNRINRLSTIQEHLMIKRAIDRGVSPERLASALCVDSTHIIKKMGLLNGICTEAAELLKDRQFSVEVSQIVRRMKSTRQIECIELMISANNLTVAYARALLAATIPDMLIDNKSPKKPAGISQEQMARMQREMSNLQGQYKLVEQTYGEDVLNLVLAKGYVTKLLSNKRVVKYLEQHQQDIMEQFVSLSETTSLEL